MRWQGHTDNPYAGWQPKAGWIPNGNLGWFRFRNGINDVNLEFLDPAASLDFSSQFQLGKKYWFKIRVETKSGGRSDYSLKAWADGQSEPGWNLMVIENSDDQPSGSFLLIAHQANATFGNVTVVSVDGPPSYSLEVDMVGNGEVDLNPPGGLYEAGTVVTLTATAEPGWLFTSWSGALTGNSNPAQLVMDSNKSVTATFTDTVTLDVNVVGQGLVEIMPSGGSGGSYPIDTELTLTPIPEPSWIFESWSGPNAGDLFDNGDGTWAITMDNNKEITGTFIEEQHQVLIPVIEKP
jgi:hypothetical protein